MTITAIVLASLIAVAGCRTAGHSHFDYGRFQQKLQAATPMSLVELVQAFQQQHGGWPTSKVDLVSFETRAYGESACVKWEPYGAFNFHPQDDGTLVMIREHDEDGITITGSVPIGPAAPVDLRDYFSRWRAGGPDQRYRLKNLELLHKVLEGETETTAIALLGRPDRDNVPIPSEYTGWWQDEMAKLLLYRVSQSEWKYAAVLRVWIKKDGTVFSVDDGDDDETQQPPERDK